MFEISKNEAEYLRKKFKDLGITRTCKGKGKAKRGKRYTEESKYVFGALKDYYSSVKNKEVKTYEKE